MTCIHVETEAVYEIARHVWQLRLLMQEELDALRAALRRLEMTWQSPQAIEFLSSAFAWVGKTEASLDNLDLLGTLLFRHAERWQQTDALGWQSFHFLRRESNT